MGMIYYDVSESRVRTRLSPRIIEAGQPIVGLEHATGADMLISPKDGLPGNVNKLPGRALLPLYIEHGFLVQRKSGADFLNSIPDLINILWRMRMAGDKVRARSWLILCGQMERSHDGMTIMDGRVTGWNWQSVQGLLESWQLLGGYISQNVDDISCANTILRWDKNIDKWLEDTERGLVNKPDIPKLEWDPKPWRSTLMTFPGCGDVMSDKIAAHNERLCDSLVWMSSMKSFGVAGVGERSLERFRTHFGLEENEFLSIFYTEPTIHA